MPSDRPVSRVHVLAATLLCMTLAAGPALADGASPSPSSSFHSGEPLGATDTGQRPLLESVPLLDLSRLHISHSLSYSFASGGPRNTSLGLYVSSFDYQFANPLSMRLDLGAAIDNATVSSGRGADVFLKGLALDYHPSDSFRIQLNYRTLPRSAYYGSRGLWPGE